MERWMAIDDVLFSLPGDQGCAILPPEADPTPSSTTSTTTTTSTTSEPYIGISINRYSLRDENPMKQYPEMMCKLFTSKFITMGVS